MDALFKIEPNEKLDRVVSGRDLHTNNPKNPWTEITNHMMTLDMAKQIAMIQRNEKGKQAREYFIQAEKAWNTPEMVFARAMEMASKVIESKRGITEGQQVMFGL